MTVLKNPALNKAPIFLFTILLVFIKQSIIAHARLPNRPYLCQQNMNLWRTWRFKILRTSASVFRTGKILHGRQSPSPTAESHFAAVCPRGALWIAAARHIVMGVQPCHLNLFCSWFCSFIFCMSMRTRAITSDKSYTNYLSAIDER
jgi:hypothetical protein